MHALYIGLVATAVSYLYLIAVPYYAQCIIQGEQANESLWWRAVFYRVMAPDYKKSQSARLCCYALAFGVMLSLCVIYMPWLPQETLSINVFVMALWLGGLWLLVRIDQLCFLLPDVITQLLLWIGLWVTTFPLTEVVFVMILVYGLGRIVNFFGQYILKKPLFGLGDVKLMVALIGWIGWQALMPLLFLACCGCVVIEAYKQKSWRPQGACAFGPYLVLATLWVWLSGGVW